MLINRIDLRHLRSLQAMRETGSLVEAAERMCVTQSALSHQLRTLEDRMDCALVLRKSRPIRFTPAGSRLLQLADEVLPQVRIALREVSQLGGHTGGRLVVGIECHSCIEWMLPAINRFRDAWPNIELDLSSGFHTQPLIKVVRAELDLVITSSPMPDLDLVYEPLFLYESMIVVSTDHKLAKKKRVYPKDLKDETIITYPIDRSRLMVFAEFLDPSGIEPADIRTSELTAMMINLAASGRGVTCLPHWMLTEFLAKKYVVAKPLGETGAWSTLYIAAREGESVHIRSFIETAKETCFESLVGIKPATVQCIRHSSHHGPEEKTTDDGSPREVC